MSQNPLRAVLTYLLICMGFCVLLTAQNKGPVAKFSFNNGKDMDEISGRKAKLVNVSHWPDRFGNDNSAIYFYGHEQSYVNLGNYPAIKPRVGTISIWFNITFRNWTGTGITSAPLILTKNSQYDDFFEAYSILFAMESNRIATNCSRDSIKQVCIPQNGLCAINRWHHAVLSFNDDSIALYFDGRLQGRHPKGFPTKYLASDSVMLGSLANKKNNRFLMGFMDEVEFYDRVLTQEEVTELYNAPNPVRKNNILQWVLTVAGIMALMLLVYFIARFQLNKIQKKERERLELTNKLLETELLANRALMNPHFVYNSLYSIQSFIVNHEIEQANNYLVKFSRLLRKTLENNTAEAVALEDEIDLLNRFLEIENLKFPQPIEYAIDTHGIFTPASLYIPVMMIQPFVENAILHGLQNKAGEKKIHISFSLKDEKYVECVVEDNGTGRKASPASPEKKSLSTSFIKTRLDLFNRLQGLQCSLEIIDKPDHSGTIVRLLMPLLNKKAGN